MKVRRGASSVLLLVAFLNVVSASAEPTKHRLISLMQDLQSSVSAIKHEVGNRRWEQLELDLQGRIAHVLDDVNYHLEVAGKQDRDDTQAFIDESLKRLQKKTRLAVEMKIAADMADHRVGH